MNPNPSARMMVMAGREFACVRLTGRANFSASVDFKALIGRLRQRGFGYFVLDLTTCELMDSTFVGGLAGFGLEMSRAQVEDSPAIELLNPNERITELLGDLGILHLFKCCHGALTAPAEGEEACAGSGASRVELARASLEAHQVLMSLNAENAARFKDVAQFLADDLRRLEAGQTGV